MNRHIPTPLRAITVHAPYAWALMQPHPCGKDVENRKASFPQLQRDNRYWIHASKSPGTRAQWDREVVDVITRMGLSDIAGQFAEVEMRQMLGHIVGSVVYHFRSRVSASAWYVPGNDALHVGQPVVLNRFVPAKGNLGVWRLTDELLLALYRASLDEDASAIQYRGEVVKGDKEDDPR